MHDCLKHEDGLLDLLFDEGGGGDDVRSRLLSEVERCGACGEQLRYMGEALRVFDAGAELALPREDFWVGYEERLRIRMAQVIPLNGFAQPAVGFRVSARADYRLTLLEDEGLARRLARQLRDVSRESQLTWPSFKEEPLRFTRRFVSAYAEFAWDFVSRRNVAAGALSSFVIVSAIVGVVFGLERLRLSYVERRQTARDDYELVGMLPTNTSIPETREEDKGSPGRASGEGGGMKPKRERPQGGGGGGREEQTRASEGKTPPGILQQQIVAPNPHPPTLKNPTLAVVPHIDADPTLFPPDYRPVPFGDPRSNAKELSAGPGEGDGIGEGEGGGVGEGRGGGYGPGEGGNTGGGPRVIGGGGPGGPEGSRGGVGERDGVLRAREVTRRAVLVSKPEPGFTEAARRNNVTGVVKLRLALRADGTVSDISVLKGLPDGLTERAIEAAKRIRFTPAQKEGRNVSQWVSVEYNFNIY